jgi:hypothetical protein
MSKAQWESLQLDIRQNAERSTTIATNTKTIKQLVHKLGNQLRKLDKKVFEPLKTTITYMDLFCGLGAFHTAFNSINVNNRTKARNINYKCVFACDIDVGVRKIYEENYGIVPHGDINNLDIDQIPDCDIMCAGIPCQPFSISGKKEGFKDVAFIIVFFFDFAQ